MDITLRFYNRQSHARAGTRHLFKQQGFMSVFFVILGIYLLLSFQKEYRRTQSYNPVYLLVNIALVCRLLAIPFELYVLYHNENTGLEANISNFLGQCFSFISIYLLNLVFIFLAHGWTITFNNIEDFELFLPISILLAVFKLVIIGLGKIQQDDEHFYHKYDSFTGWILAAFKFGMYIYFLVGLMDLYEAKKQAGIRKFLVQIGFFGSVYFMLFPIALLTQFFCDEMLRESYIEIMVFMAQIVGFIFMAFTTTNKKGDYQQVKGINEMLPGRFGV
jgi:hypothetical protein